MLPWVVCLIWTLIVGAVYVAFFPSFSPLWPVALMFGVGAPMFIYFEKIEKRTD